MVEKAPDITIGAVRERTEITPEGRFQVNDEIEFFVDDARHTVTIPKSQYSARAAEDAVKKAAAEIVAVHGKKITTGK